MINRSDISRFLNQYNYDIRINGNGRWIDQKCTPDIVSIVADCVLEYIFDSNNKEEFSSLNIWHNKYTVENVEMIFSKPGLADSNTKNEYDKFFAHPLEMFVNAKILNKQKKGRTNYYTVNNLDILEYISLREKNALNFIDLYVEKVLRDSGLWNKFELFFKLQTPDQYYNLKESYEDFIIRYTPINGKTEVRRIFAKVINPLAFSRKKLGTVRGRISRNIITFATLMYNQENFRDISADKPKNLTRQEWQLQNNSKVNKKLFIYQAEKAKKIIRKFNDDYRNGHSELNDQYSNGLATQMHHIFPQSSFPEISMYYENIIALTPTQHFNKAHPKNHTSRIDPIYQELLLKAKAGTIEWSSKVLEDDSIYEFDKFVEVLNVGFDEKHEIRDSDFETAMLVIDNYYNN